MGELDVITENMRVQSEEVTGQLLRATVIELPPDDSLSSVSCSVSTSIHQNLPLKSVYHSNLLLKTVTTFLIGPVPK